MNNFELIELKSAKHVKLFHSMAREIYRGDPSWIQPLVVDIEKVFDPKHNPLFEQDGGGQAIRWIVSERATGRIVGRLAAFYNAQKAAIEAQPTGGCGFFECIDSQEVASMLFDAARDWLKARGLEAMDGPINFGDRLQWWGLLVDGFHEPLYGMPYARPYYAALMENYGFQLYFNQITYRRPFFAGIELPEAIRAKAERLYANPEYEFHTFDKKNIAKMARDFCAIYNSGWAKIEGIKPLTEQGAAAMIGSMKPIIDPKVLYLGYHNGLPVSFFVMIPDINQLIKPFGGKFGLWQKLRLLCGLRAKKIDRLAGLIFGVAAAYQGKGLEAAMICQMQQYIDDQQAFGRTQYCNLEMGWVGDFNPVMMRMCESYIRAERYKRHVTYRYLMDRSAPFVRCARVAQSARPV